MYRGNSEGYIPGQPWSICDRCCQKRRLSALATEWTGFRVCPECFDPRPPQLDPPNVWPEGVPLPNARPRPADIFVTDSSDVPNVFSFIDKINASLNTVYTSNSISVVGNIGSLFAISIVGGSYSINGGSYASAAGTVAANTDSVTVHRTSSSAYSTAVDVVLTIGGISDTYTITTIDDPGPPPVLGSPTFYILGF